MMEREKINIRNDEENYFEEIEKKDFFEKNSLLEGDIKNGLISSEKMFSLFRSTKDSGFKALILEKCALFSEHTDASDCLDLLSDEVLNAFGDEHVDAVGFLEGIGEPEKSYLLEKYGSYTNDILFNVSVRSLGSFGERGEEILLSNLEEGLLKEIDLEGVNNGGVRDFKSGIGRHEDFASAYSRQKEKLGNIKDLKNIAEKKDKEGDKSTFEGKWNEDVDYPYGSEILKQLAKTGSRKSVDFCIELLEKSRHSTVVYKKEMENIFKNVDWEYAEEKLTNLLKGGEEDTKNRAVKMLFRLELEKIGMAENNLDYLEKYYDSLPADSFQKIFSRYGEIIRLSANAKDGLRTVFKDDKDFSGEEIDRLSFNLANKANELLVAFGGKKEGSVAEEEVVKKLEKFKTDLIFTLSIFKTFKKEGKREDIGLDDLKGIAFEVEKAGETVNQTEDAEQMIDIYSANYADKPALRDKIVSGFKEKLDNPPPGLKVYKMKKNGRILAFCRFEDLGDKKYFGSFNVAPEMRDSGIGHSFFQKIMEEEMQDGRPLEADCLADSPITSYYIGPKGGFVAGKINHNYGHSGFDLINISKNKGGGIYYYQNRGETEIAEEAKNAQNADGERFVLEFAKGSKEFYQTSEKLFGEGYIMTRYFFSPDKKSAYGAFERKVAEEKSEIREAA
jgi:hypothetical protein